MATKKRKAAKPKKKNMKGRKRGGATVPCPKCGADSEVLITRREGEGVNRRRQCHGTARHLFDTREVLWDQTNA